MSKYNPNYVKVFYYNLELTTTGLESRFKNKVKFDYSNFSKYFGFPYDGSDMSVANSSDFDKVSFVLSISKSFCENMEM